MDFTNFPNTIIEFDNRFRDERACWDYLAELKWPDGFTCDKCKGRRSYYIIDRHAEECASCGHQASISAGTMFHGTRTSLRLWFRAIFEFVSRKHGCNAMDIMRLLGLSYPTSWAWLQKIRDVLRRPDREPLSGIVEVDETYVGASEAGIQGRDLGEAKILLAGAVEVVRKGCGRVRLAPIESASAEHLQPFVVEAVAEGSRVHSDGWGGYNQLDEAYGHKVTKVHNPKTASKKFPRIHRVFSLFRRVLLGTYHGSWSKKYAQLYCDEYEFRFNRRTSATRTHLFRRVLEHAVRRRPRLHQMAGSKCKGPVVPAGA